jgi:elongator complex protein 4
VKSSTISKTEDNNKTISSNRVLGVKPWIQSGSCGLVSTGNKQLDDLVGGGTALGSVVVFTIDNFSNYSDTLLFYNIAESISVQHHSLLIVENKDRANYYISSLPYNLTYASKEKELLETDSVSCSIDRSKVVSEVRQKSEFGDFIFSG